MLQTRLYRISSGLEQTSEVPFIHQISSLYALSEKALEPQHAESVLSWLATKLGEVVTT